MEELHFKLVEIREDKVIFDDKTHLSIKPMIGVIGVAPEYGQVNCGTPGSHGGNMDTKLITEGAKLYLPVFVEGAKFGLGDLHVLMGDGEIGVSGVEVAGKVVVEFRVLKKHAISNPIIKTNNMVATIASHATLDGAASIAVHDMANIFKKFTKMEIKDISMLFSIAGNLEISQVVDPLKTARFSKPNIVLENYEICFLLI
jgi:amidase